MRVALDYVRRSMLLLVIAAHGEARADNLFGGPNSIFNNPGQLKGGPNSVINNPGQLKGGPNSVINNPGQVTQAIANALNELQASLLTGPTLERAIVESRRTSINGSISIPPQIRKILTGYASEDSMNRVRYKIGDNGFVNLAHLLEQGGAAAAVTLIDVVVFRGPSEAADPSIWAHELTHVDQYQAWGVHSFAVHYARDYRSVEDPAYAKGDGFWAWHQKGQTSGPAVVVEPQCSDEKQEQSLNSKVSTFVNFDNQSAGVVKTYWLDYHGTRIFYHQLQPGEHYSQQTYVSHPWVVTDYANNCLRIVLPDATPKDVAVH